MPTSKDSRDPIPGPDGPVSVGRRRRVPPLVWLVAALLVVIVVITVRHWNGTYHSPTGGTAPMVANGHTVMPANPGRNGAPATPASQG